MRWTTSERAQVMKMSERPVPRRKLSGRLPWERSRVSALIVEGPSCRTVSNPCTPRRSRSLKSVLCTMTLLRSAPSRSALLRSALLRLAPLRSALLRQASPRSAPHYSRTSSSQLFKVNGSTCLHLASSTCRDVTSLDRQRLHGSQPHVPHRVSNSGVVRALNLIVLGESSHFLFL